MKTIFARFSCSSLRLVEAITSSILITSALGVFGQGIITFDAHPYFAGTNYIEMGMQFRVIIPTSGTIDYMGIAPAITTPANIPYNPTPYMYFIRQHSHDNYVAFSLTSGADFGLISVSLADANSPSYSQLPITFVGLRADGSSVTQTFTTPGGGANSFLTYQFGLDFASGLLSVRIEAPRWAMDNLVFVIPEPSTFALAGAVLVAVAVLRLCRRRKP